MADHLELVYQTAASSKQFGDGVYACEYVQVDKGILKFSSEHYIINGEHLKKIYH